MMDVLMIAILLGCFGLWKAFADFCDWQINQKKNRRMKQNGYDCFRCYDCRSWDLSGVCIDKSRKIVKSW